MFVSEEECLIFYDQAFIYLSMQGNLILLQCIFYFRFLPQKCKSCMCTLKFIPHTINLTFMLQNIAFLWFNCIFAFMYLYLRCENNEIDVKISTFGVRKFCVQLKRQVQVDVPVKVFSTSVPVMVLYVKFSIFGVKMGGQCRRSLCYAVFWFLKSCSIQIRNSVVIAGFISLSKITKTKPPKKILILSFQNVWPMSAFMRKAGLNEVLDNI